MKLSDKLIELRKAHGWSQEDFAEKLDVSRQAISRWENGTALPDAQNILRISQLFNITADYLLNDDYESVIAVHTPETAKAQITQEGGAPSVEKKKKNYVYPILVICLALLAFLAIIIFAINSNAHTHPTLSYSKENEIAPTCTADGSYDDVVYCAECEEEISRTTKSLQKLNHTLSNSIKENEIPPTCKADGSYDEVVYCAECGEELLRTHRTTAKVDHQFQNRKCAVCGEDQPSEGLLYMPSSDGTCAVAIGDCTDEIIVIPEHSPNGEKVTQVKAYAFAYNKKIKSVRIPETATAVGEGAFMDCINLESVNLPKNITIIYPYTFSGCEKLKELTIPPRVVSIGEEAFAECYAFESIVIPASVTKIGRFAFRNFSRCEGTVKFAINDGWAIYDFSEEMVDVIDFSNRASDPIIYIGFKYCEYLWQRN